MALTIAPLLPADLDAALTLSTLEGWNQTAADWRRLLALAPDGCFAAREGDRVLGTVTSTSYGRDLAWIGMMVVHPEARRRGIGATLMRSVLEHLRECGIASLMLDATPAGRPLYESLGFASEGEFERWQGVPRIGAPPARLLPPRDPERAMFALDLAAHGADRSRLLATLVAEGLGEPLVVADAVGAPAGFALARAGRNATYLGPLIATTAAAAPALLDALLARFAGSETCLDLQRGGPLEPGMLAARGFSLRRSLTRMRLGPLRKTGAAAMIGASAGPEFG